ncbi:hypothetical protein OHD16_15400 [Sphingobacterium sp. ML3W]|uniref:hypothetical protein n=1 Tax=Sphingobacterium sp. ML3W TaxID=1538644 RepID=UPI00249C123F|nr:hypothetical protein [Sphingobacterium sp. ML3W]WFA81341.1 hypothetical protein OGI71_08545 [Sphingobacterium sp. ML3W]
MEAVSKQDLEMFRIRILSNFQQLLQDNQVLIKDDFDWLRSKAIRKMMDISPATLQNLRISGKYGTKKSWVHIITIKLIYLKCLTMKTDVAKKGLIYLDNVCHDSRLNVWHICLLLAIARLAFRQNESTIIRVSRSKLMTMSHINTTPTYHKYFKELQNYGYIKYTPSYHQGYRSTIEILHLYQIEDSLSN